MTRSIHRFAADDLVEAARRYKVEAGAGLARRFLDEFERIAKLLEEFPGIGMPTGEGQRRLRRSINVSLAPFRSPVAQTPVSNAFSYRFVAYAVPEPEAVELLLVGLGLLAVGRRRASRRVGSG